MDATNHSSQGNIPFSWENRPGVRKDGQENVVGRGRRKEVHVSKEGRRKEVYDSWATKEGRMKEEHDTKEERRKLSLPPPPCEHSNKAARHDIGLPLPPCTFQPPLRSLSRRSKDDDPFLMAYKECTKSNKKGTLMRTNSFLGSCKYSCSVRDDSIVRVSHIPPMSNSDRKRFEGVKY
ncbi:hypothetical protein L2E82_26322 [Cichorium intybus]|uniref:Uncharacterized protein n=1 Tax=Cichorium intybus TaxID=13427 RepID=A0ACB9CQB4_CICIN|nr:hypothetical protein L2E82_26322 [Cichorium intybus]